MNRQNDLPIGHQQSHERPSYAEGYSRELGHQRPVKKGNPYSISPPLKARCFDVIVGTSEPNAVLLENMKRRSLSIQNKGGASVFISFATPINSTGENGIEVPSGSFFSLSGYECPVDNVYIVGSTSSIRVNVVECALIG